MRVFPFFELPISFASCSCLLDLDVPWPTTEEVEGRAGHVAPRGITFDRFMRACVVVKQLKESFEALDRDPLGRVKINYEQFLGMVFKLP